MIHKINPVLIGGFDVIYLGRKGFSSLARATRALVRPKGAPKTDPWLEIDFKKAKKKLDKDKLLTKVLYKISKKRGEEAETALREAKKKAAKTPKSDKIKFELQNVNDKLVRTQDGQFIETRKYFFSVPKSIEFVEGRDMSIDTINTYIQAVKREFLKEVFSKYGTTHYLIRFYHDYENLESNQINDPLDRGFSGLGLNRQEMNREDAIEQFDILSEIYLESFGKYLQFARGNTYVRFTGFTVEVTLKARIKPFGHGTEFIKTKKKKKKSAKKKPAKKKPRRK